MRKPFVLRFFWLFFTAFAIAVVLISQSAITHQRKTVELQQLAERIRLDIDTVSTRSTTMGAVITMGLLSEGLKNILRHPELKKAPLLHHQFDALLQEYDADVSFLMNDQGNIVDYYDKSAPNQQYFINVAFRPYWRLGIRGLNSVYPAVSVTDDIRSFYIAASVHETWSDTSDPIGVFAIRKSAAILDETLANYNDPVMIVSNDGIVFSSNQPDWILKLTHTLTPEQQAKLKENRQLGKLIADPAHYQYLPFKLQDDYLMFQDKTYATHSVPLDWPDIQGQWRLVVLEDTSTWVSVWEQSIVTGIVLLTMLGLYLIIRLRNRIEQTSLAAVYAQQQIQQRAKQHLKQMSDSLPLAIFQIKMNLRYSHWSYTYASAKCKDILGINPLELLLDYRILDKHIYPDDADYILDLFHLSLEQKTDFEFEHRILRNNEIVWVKVKAICSQIGPEEWIWNGYWRDVTDQRRQNQQLKEAKETAEEANRTKSMFLANMSHEIRTPMNAVIGLAYLALKTELTPKQRDYLNKIHQAGSNLLDIINDILDFSKIEANQLKLEQTAFNLDDVLANLSIMSSQRAHEKGLELLFDVPPDIPRGLIGDPLRLGQILINLISNAVKFTEHGYVHLQIREMACHETEVTLQFVVRDTGIGMTQAQIGRLFQAFTQADGSTTRRFGGTGLGLTIVRHLVEEMGGTIRVTSEPDAGSQFSFTAQLHIGQINNEKRQLIPRSITGLRILVVDDNQIASDILVAALRQLPLHPEAVNSAEEALFRLQQAADAGNPYHLLMTDWQMPDMDGMMLAEKVRGMPCPPRIVLVTAFSYDEVQEQAKRVGIEAFLTKPISQSQVVDCLMRLLASPPEETAAALEQIELPQFRQSKVLLAEDNPINQQIAVELMVACGIHTDVAANGQEALNLLFSHAPGHYDLVFMDLQMPEMDGHEATQAIRADNRFQQLPIIAMTAHALQDERDRCLAEGMNDHIAKPINPDRFYKLLKHYLVYKLTGSSASVSNTHTLPEISGLDSKTALKRVNGNQTFYLQLLEQYRRDQGDTATHIREFITAQQPEHAQSLAHSLKGVSANIGATRISALAAELELALSKQQPSAELLSLAGALETALLQLCTQLETLIATQIDSEQTAAIPATDEAIATLMKMISDNDCGALDLFAQLESGLQQRIPLAELQQINHHLQSFDFDLALIRLERFTLTPSNSNKQSPDAGQQQDRE